MSLTSVVWLSALPRSNYRSRAADAGMSLFFWWHNSRFRPQIPNSCRAAEPTPPPPPGPGTKGQVVAVKSCLQREEIFLSLSGHAEWAGRTHTHTHKKKHVWQCGPSVVIRAKRQAAMWSGCLVLLRASAQKNPTRYGLVRGACPSPGEQRRADGIASDL